MSSFQINATDPPDSGYPHGDRYRFELPQPSGIGGQGQPVGAVGKARLEIWFDILPEDGWQYYSQIVGPTANYVTLTSIRLWNPHASGGAGAWVTYSSTGIMHRPTQQGWTYGGYQDVHIVFTELS